MISPSILAIILTFLPGSNCTLIGGHSGHGLIGYGLSMYDPFCASACAAVIPTTVECPNDDNTTLADTAAGPGCLAYNEPYLKSMAWCVHLYCSDISLTEIESWWESNVPQRQTRRPLPSISYAQALGRINEPPAQPLEQDAILNTTVTVSNESYVLYYKQLLALEKVERNSSQYGYEYLSKTRVSLFLPL